MSAEHEVWFQGGRLRVAYSKDDRVVLNSVTPMASLKNSKQFGRHWQCPPPDAAQVVDWADKEGRSVAPEVRQYADEAWIDQLSAHALSSAAELPEGETLPEVRGLATELLKSQEVVVAAAANHAEVSIPGRSSRHRALIVADEPGLGKTLVALSALRIKGREFQRSVIICPTSLTSNWQNEMTDHFEVEAFRPWSATGESPEPIPPEADTVVIGWDVLPYWVDDLKRWKPDAVVVDEGHYAKSGKQRKETTTTQKRDKDGKAERDEHGNVVMEEKTRMVGGSARATAALSLGAAVAKTGGLLMGLTGTPIVNRPVELEPLIEFVGIIDLFGGSAAFKNRFCDPKPIPGPHHKMDYSGASNLLELHSRLASTGNYVRRTKELLVDGGALKPKYVDGVYIYDRTTRPNPWIIRGSEEEMADYRAAETDLEGFLAERAREIAASSGGYLNSEKVRKKVAGETVRHLQKIATLRKLSAQVKVKHILAKVNEIVERGERIVIAAHHREIVDAYADSFSGLKIQGDMGPKEIEHAKFLFNTTPQERHPVMVLSVEAGKTGHTLCKQTLNDVGPSCAFMVFAEQVWTPGDETQAQDRIWRIGQEREVRIVNALLADSIDMPMYGQRQRKSVVVNAAVDAISPEVRSDGVGALLWSMAQKGLAA